MTDFKPGLLLGFCAGMGVMFGLWAHSESQRIDQCQRTYTAYKCKLVAVPVADGGGDE